MDIFQQLDRGKDEVTRDKAGRAYPPRPLVGVAAVVFHGDRAILVRRLNEPGRGQWSLPGGAVKLGETLVDALKREVREELSIEIEIGGLVGVFDKIFADAVGQIAYHYVLIDFWADLASGVPAAGSDIDAFRWLNPAEGDDLSLDRTLKSAVARAVRLKAAGPSAAPFLSGSGENAGRPLVNEVEKPFPVGPGPVDDEGLAPE